MNKRKLLFIIITLIIIIFILFIFISRKNKKNVDNVINVDVIKVSLDNIVSKIKTKGEVLVSENILLHADNVAEIESVEVKLNDLVNEGQTVIKFKDGNKEKLERQLKESKLNLKSAEIALENIKILDSDLELENAKLNISKVEQSINDIELNLEQIDININQQKRLLDEANKKLENARTLFSVGAVTKNYIESIESEVRKLEDGIELINNQKRQAEQSRSTMKLNLQSAINQYEELKNKFNNQKNINKNAIRQQEIIVERNRLQIKQIEDDIKNFQSELKSPISGIVTDIKVSKGDIVQQGKDIIEISNTKKYIVTLYVNERYINKLCIGQEIELEGSFLEKELLKGKISKISPIAKVNKIGTTIERVVPVEVKLDNEEKASLLLKAGFSVDATIITDFKKNVTVIPILSTLSEKDGSNFVYVVNQDSILEKRNVELGTYSDMVVEVKGVSEGEIIVLQPNLDLKEGVEVNFSLDNSSSVNKGDD